MRHLTPGELVDALERRLPKSRLAHLVGCDACRRRVDELHATLDGARQNEVPEPSPLFWHHLSGRIREAIAAERVEPLPWWRRRAAVRWSPAPVAIVLILGGLAWLGGAMFRPADMPPPAVASMEAVAAGSDGDPDSEWALVVRVADGLALDEAAEVGWALGPAGAERALVDLTAEERRELARLLEAELGRPES